MIFLVLSTLRLRRNVNRRVRFTVTMRCVGSCRDDMLLELAEQFFGLSP